MKLSGRLIRFVKHVEINKLNCRLIEFLSLFICLSLIFGVGPQAQLYLFSLVESRSITIYGSAYQDSIAHFPPLLEWLRGAMQWQPLITGGLVSGLSLRYSSPRKFLKAVAVSSFLILVLYDVAIGILQKLLTPNYVVENVVADFLGSIGASIIILVVVIGFEFVVRHADGLDILKRMQGAVLVVASGIVVSCLSFYVFKIFYMPLPVEMDVLLAHPISGAFVFDATHVDSDKKSTAFQIFPPEIGNGSVEWNSPMKPLDVIWKAAGVNFIYDAKLELYSDCLTQPHAAVSHPQNQTIDYKNIHNLSISFGQGMNMLAIGTAESSGKILLKTGNATLFWLDQDQENGHLKITQFIDNKSDLIYKNPGGAITFYIYSPLMAVSDSEAKYASQDLYIRTDTKEHSFKIGAPHPAPDSKGFECKLLPIKRLFNDGYIEAPSGTSILGILVQITEKPKANVIYDSNSSSLKVIGRSGWLNVNNLDKDALASGSPGQVGGIQFQGNIANLELNGSPAVVQPSATYMAIGHLTGSFDTTGHLRFLGNVKALWADGNRLNPTRWETWPWELRIFVLGLFTTAGSLILRLAFACLSKNENFNHFQS